MKVSLETRDLSKVPADLVAVPLFQRADGAKGRWLSGAAAALDKRLDGVIATALESGDFKGRRNDSLVLYPSGDGAPRRVLLLGLGEAKAIDLDALRLLAGRAVRAGNDKGCRKIALLVPPLRKPRPAESAQALAEGGVLASYRYGAYKPRAKDAPRETEQLSLVYEKLPQPAAGRAGAKRGVVLAESQNVARELSDMPGNALPPAELGRCAQKVGREAGVRVKVMNTAELKRRKMGGILAVGGGSAREPRLIVMEHDPKRKGAPTVALVGKGITFDSGGISIKPATGMEEMKHDMGGAAAVVGALRAAALLKLPVRVVGVIAAAENLPSGTAYRPGDIVTTSSGKTIEILNTDAEGRVVLADALHYARTEFKPEAIVDLATLTGACMIALGPWATGLFSNSERLSDHLRVAGEATGEIAWPLPLFEEHREQMRSRVADLRNAGGREAGASTAAGFLAAFVGETPWAHLDIAGSGWVRKATPIQPVGATGVGVRLLLEALTVWKAGKPV
ncbi:MAG: leucyl aminopeptidase [Proteobacteria bacterium]|nr:leucyl aminopeptidase [Pseudomonadota bacterium]